jgi:hypothetical protein
MPEWAEGGNNRPNLDKEERKEIADKMMAKYMGKPFKGEVSNNGTPFSDDELTFLAMAFRDLESKLGWRGKRLLKKKYDPISETFLNWKEGKRE